MPDTLLVTRRRGLVALTALATLGLVATNGHAADEDAPQIAVASQAAESWLAGVDAQAYGPSWDQAGGVFRAAVPRAQWAAGLEHVRGPLGALGSRTLDSARFSRSLPGAPDGQYVVLRYKAVFEHKAQGAETVTVQLDTDGAWRVVGYFIQ